MKPCLRGDPIERIARDPEHQRTPKAKHLRHDGTGQHLPEHRPGYPYRQSSGTLAAYCVDKAADR